MGKQKIVGKRWMSALLALILTVTLLPAPSAAADDSLNVENAIQNPGFETPSIRTTSSQMPQENVQDWETTAKEGMIEFGGNWNGHTAPHYSTSRDKNNAEGYQFAELNADEESTLYQNVMTVGGNVYEWGLQHRGRIGAAAGKSRRHRDLLLDVDGEDAVRRICARGGFCISARRTAEFGYHFLGGFPGQVAGICRKIRTADGQLDLDFCGIWFCCLAWFPSPYGSCFPAHRDLIAK